MVGGRATILSGQVISVDAFYLMYNINTHNSLTHVLAILLSFYQLMFLIEVA